MRKASWAGRMAGKGYGDLDGDKEDKENSHPLNEDDEDEAEDYATPRQDEIVLADPDLADPSEVGEGDDRSETETLRRSSMGTTVITGYTGSEVSTDADYSDHDETASEWTESAVGSSIVSGGGEGNEVALYQG